MFYLLHHKDKNCAELEHHRSSFYTCASPLVGVFLIDNEKKQHENVLVFVKHSSRKLHLELIIVLSVTSSKNHLSHP